MLLFDGLIVLTKANTRRASVTGPVSEYKLKEKFNIRKIDIVDREDTEGERPSHDCFHGFWFLGINPVIVY